MKLVKGQDVKPVSVSHNPDILKRVFFQDGDIPHLTQFGEATFQPGQSTEKHLHETMIEVFYILQGKVKFWVEGEEFDAESGDCVMVEAGELHMQSNPFDGPMTWVYFGIAI